MLPKSHLFDQLKQTKAYSKDHFNNEEFYELEFIYTLHNKFKCVKISMQNNSNRFTSASTV